MAWAARRAGFGNVLKRLQSGNIRSYAAWVLLGSVVLLLVMGVMGGAAMNLLDIVLAIPLLGFLAVLMVPRAAEGAIRATALAFSLVAFAASLGLAFQYETIRPG